MPGTYPNELSAIDKEVIRQWILYGAKNAGTLFDKSVIEEYYTNGGEQSFPNGAPAAPAASEGFQIKMGPFFLPADGEVEYFQKYELLLPADIEVNRLDFNISPFSHHFLTYNFTGNGANSIPAGLRLDANHSQINLVAAVQEETSLVLPNKTAFKWDNNLVLDLNAHYINYSLTKPYLCEAYVNVYTQTPGTAEQEMFAALMVNGNIPIPNNSDLITYSKAEYQFGADSIYIWGLTGHTHKYGRGYKVWNRLPNGQKGELIYDAACPQGIPGCPAPWYDYQHIPLRYWEPLMPLNWGNGIIHEAQWVNDGPTPVNFGPTSDDEMMVLIAFYTEQPIATTSSEPSFSENHTLPIFPNPTKGSFRVTQEETIHRLTLFNVAGQVVFQRENAGGNSLEIEAGDLPSGLYMLDVDGQKAKVLVQY
jgi:hypothetical protein